MSTITYPGQAVGRLKPSGRPWWQRLVIGREDDARWVRPALLALLAATAVLYVADLSASGYANSFYAAAVEAGTRSWKAFFFGSFDSSNFITVDKPPASLWVMELFGRTFGFSSWSLLLPQALEGVACVGILYAAVRRQFGPAAGLIAGGALAATPVAALMFRFDNPDALLVLLMTVAAYAIVRALEMPETRSATRWMIGAGVALGFAFLTKTLQAFLVLPAFALVYLFAANAPLRRRLFQLFSGGVALVVSAGWWLAAVSLWPASSRPYIGGSQDNSEWNLIFGYNGFGRLTGNETGSVGGHATTAGGGMWGTTGLFRMFGSEMGSQISWLLPTALLLGLAVLWLRGRSARTDVTRAHVLLWLGWLVVTALTFSFAKGIIHPYYTVALAPAIAALVGIGAVTLWRERPRRSVRIAGAVVLVVTALWGFDLLDRSPSWLPWLRWLLLVAGIGAAVALVTLRPTTSQNGDADDPSPGSPKARWVGAVVAAAAIVVGLGAPALASVDTAKTPHTGAIPSAGPSQVNNDFLSSAGGNGFGGPGGMLGRGFAARGFGAPPAIGGSSSRGGFPGSSATGGSGTGGFAGPPGFGGSSTGGSRPGGSFPTGTFPGGGTSAGGSSTGGFPGSSSTGGFPGAPGFGSSSTGGLPGSTGHSSTGTGSGGFIPIAGGAVGGLLNSGTVSTAVADALKDNASDYTWVAAAIGANSAAGFQLATDEPVMAIGGFNGTDPAPTLAQFKAYVAAGKIHYFIAGGGGMFSMSFGGGRLVAVHQSHGASTSGAGTRSSTPAAPTGGMAQQGGSDDSSQIQTWVESHFTKVTVDGTVLYDLTQPKS